MGQIGSVYRKSDGQVEYQCNENCGHKLWINVFDSDGNKIIGSHCGNNGLRLKECYEDANGNLVVGSIEPATFVDLDSQQFNFPTVETLDDCYNNEEPKSDVVIDCGQLQNDAIDNEVEIVAAESVHNKSVDIDVSFDSSTDSSTSSQSSFHLDISGLINDLDCDIDIVDKEPVVSPPQEQEFRESDREIEAAVSLVLEETLDVVGVHDTLISDAITAAQACGSAKNNEVVTQDRVGDIEPASAESYQHVDTKNNSDDDLVWPSDTSLDGSSTSTIILGDDQSLKNEDLVDVVPESEPTSSQSKSSGGTTQNRSLEVQANSQNSQGSVQESLKQNAPRSQQQIADSQKKSQSVLKWLTHLAKDENGQSKCSNAKTRPNLRKRPAAVVYTEPESDPSDSDDYIEVDEWYDCLDEFQDQMPSTSSVTNQPSTSCASVTKLTGDNFSGEISAPKNGRKRVQRDDSGYKRRKVAEGDHLLRPSSSSSAPCPSKSVAIPVATIEHRSVAATYKLNSMKATCDLCNESFSSGPDAVLHEPCYSKGQSISVDGPNGATLTVRHVQGNSLLKRPRLTPKSNGVGPFKCPFCTEWKLFQGDLRSHLIVHFPAPYECIKCGHRCLSEKSMKYHVRSEHVKKNS